MGDDDGSFAAHHPEQLRRWAATTLVERLAWFWQAKLIAARALGAATRTGGASRDAAESASDVREAPP